MKNINDSCCNNCKPVFNNHSVFSFLTVFFILSCVIIGFIGLANFIVESHSKQNLAEETEKALANTQTIENFLVYENAGNSVKVFALTEPTPITIRQ